MHGLHDSGPLLVPQRERSQLTHPASGSLVHRAGRRSVSTHYGNDRAVRYFASGISSVGYPYRVVDVWCPARVVGEVQHKQLPEGLVRRLVFDGLSQIRCPKARSCGVAEFPLDLGDVAPCTVEGGNDVRATTRDVRVLLSYAAR